MNLGARASSPQGLVWERGPLARGFVYCILVPECGLEARVPRQKETHAQN
jgi:hypothetical protein